MGKLRKRKSFPKENGGQPPQEPKSTDDVNDNSDEEEETVPKWYDEFPIRPVGDEKLSDDELISIRIEAQTILEEETKLFTTKSAKNRKGLNSSWMKTVMTKGTAKDKVAASVVTIQNSPIHSLSVLTNLVNSVKASKKKECILVMETLCDLFIEDLLRQNSKLRPFAKQPLAHLDELTSGCARSRRQWLAAWMFEDKLKEVYSKYIEAVTSVAKDTVDSNRIKVVTTLNKLLSSHPEQEQLLLNHIINKLGDPNQKVVSKVIYCLTQLLRIHPNMKQTVLDEVEKLLFRAQISQRAQYYSICFLSQYVFSDDDRSLARNIIDIYFSFFKALIKKGEVDSRMLGVLLMGVKRAYPFAKLDEGSLSKHVDTLYKLVHLSKFNIALHALCLLQEISGANQDRYYSALYKKLLDPALGKSCHHAMFINLLYKALSKDSNADRTKSLLKRLFQLCFHLPVPVVTAILYMVSQLLNKREKLLFADSLVPQIEPSIKIDDADEEEVYFDVDKIEDQDPSDIKEEEKEKKPLRGWVHYEFNRSEITNRSKTYDPFHRNPAFSHAEKTAYLELVELSKHYHPTVALFVDKILNRNTITYDGDPLADFTLSRFLERFVFKNPKNLSQDEGKGPDPLLASRKYYQPRGAKMLNVRSSNYLEHDEKDIPVDEIFLFKYLKVKHELKKESGQDDDDDNESVASDQFEEMLDRMMGGKKKKKLDYMEEIGESLKKPKDLKGKKRADEEEEERGDSASSGSESEPEDEDVDMSDIDIDEEDDDDEVMDFDEGERDFGDVDLVAEFDDQRHGKSKKRKLSMDSKSPKKGKKDQFDSLFAPAEEFAEILEEAGSAKEKPGMHSSVSTKDNAAQKQLDWEKKRDMWVRDRGNFNKKRRGKGKPGKFKKR